MPIFGFGSSSLTVQLSPLDGNFVFLKLFKFFVSAEIVKGPDQLLILPILRAALIPHY